MARALLFTAVCLIACARAKPRETPVEAPAPVEPKEAVAKLLAQAYRAVEQGEPEALEGLLTADVMAFGLGPQHTFNARGGISALVHQELVPFGLRGDTLSLEASDPQVALSPDGESAWLFDLPRLRIERKSGGGSGLPWLPRITAHAVRAEGAWRFDAVHVSIGAPDDRLNAPDARRVFLPPDEVTPEVKPGADELVGLTRRLIADMGVKLDKTSDRPEVALVGTSTDDEYEGGKAFKDLVRPLLKQVRKSGSAWTVEGSLRARLSPSAQTGWVAGHVVLRVGKGKKALTYPPFRSLWIFANEDGIWRLVSEHQSLGLLPEQRFKPTDAQGAGRAARLEARAAARKALEKMPAPPSAPDAGQAMEAW